MIGAVELIGAAGTISLLDPFSHIWLEEEDGLGIAPLHRISERGPQQHGATDLGYRLDPRVITLVVGVGGNDIRETYAARRTLQQVCSPRGAIKLRYTLTDGAVRQIDCHYRGGMTFPSSQRQGFWDRTGIELVASNPTFYDPTPMAVVWTVGGATGTGFVFPITFPIAFGSATINTTTTVPYAGDEPAFPVLQIVGPITSPVITNQTTGDVLNLSGTTIAAGEYFVIDTRYGAKTVVDSATPPNNRIAALSDDSDLATFHIAPAPEASDGINVLHASGTGATDATRIIVRYYTTYQGP